MVMHHIILLALYATGGTLNSGLKIGELVPAYEPHHATGPDAGTDTCPVCKYGLLPGVQMWVNSADTSDLGPAVDTLEKSLSKHGLNKLRGWVVFVKPQAVTAESMNSTLAKFSAEHHLKSLGLVWVKGPTDEPVKLYSINTSPKVKTTTIVYAKMKVKAKFTLLPCLVQLLAWEVRQKLGL